MWGRLGIDNIIRNKGERERETKEDINAGSGCGSIGRAVTSNSRGLQFESSHGQKFIFKHLLPTNY